MLPWTASPEVVGAAVFAGVLAMTVVGADTTDAAPASLVAVTVTSTVEPTSELPST